MFGIAHFDGEYHTADSVLLLFSFVSRSGSLIRPKVVRSVHFCPATKKTMERRYTDMTSLSGYPSSSAYPTKDEDGNPLETEYGLSVYKDHQTFTIQVHTPYFMLTNLMMFQTWLGLARGFACDANDFYLQDDS